MAQYTVTHACGHQATVKLYGPNKVREWRIKQLQHELCDACVEEKRRQRSEEAAAANQEMGLPSLTGSERQVAWAETIRRRIMDDLELFVSGVLEDAPNEVCAKFQERIDVIMSQTEARWWIDRRDYSVEHILEEIDRHIRFGQIKAPVTKTEAEVKAEVEAKAEATVRPTEPVTETVAEIRIVEDVVIVEFPEKREDFRELIRFKLRFQWSSGRSAWLRKIGRFAGTPEDRAVETGHRLLAAGFPIRIYDEELRRRAIAGEYAPEIRRWVKRRTDGQYKDWFDISWPQEEDFYRVASRLRGSRWDREHKCVVVPQDQWNEVLDFAERYGFGVSPAAQELADQARRIQEAALVANVKPRKEASSPKPSTKPPLLNVPSEVEIDDDLRDDD